MLSNYLAISPLIIARIRAEVPAIVDVLPAQDLATLTESTLRTPSAFVIYDGDNLGDTAGRGQAQGVKQRWLIVLAIRNARQNDGGAGLAADAGPLISDLLTALQGWQPDSTDYRPLTRVAAPRPGYSPAFAFYPLAFETQIITTGA